MTATATTTPTNRRSLGSAGAPTGARKRSCRRLRHACIAGFLAAATVIATAGSLALPEPAHAASCGVKGGVWSPVRVRQSPNTTSNVLASIQAGQVYGSSCGVITGGGYTACSSSGSFENRWVPIIQQGYVAYRCVIGPYVL